MKRFTVPPNPVNGDWVVRDSTGAIADRPESSRNRARTLAVVWNNNPELAESWSGSFGTRYDLEAQTDAAGADAAGRPDADADADGPVEDDSAGSLELGAADDEADEDWDYFPADEADEAQAELEADNGPESDTDGPTEIPADEETGGSDTVPETQPETAGDEESESEDDGRADEDADGDMMSQKEAQPCPYPDPENAWRNFITQAQANEHNPTAQADWTARATDLEKWLPEWVLMGSC